MPHLTPREQAYRCFAHAAPWMPLDDLHAQWAAFGRRASTEAATMATSEAFAALAEEREALHAYTHAPQWCRRTGCLVVGLHEGSMDGLRVAAMHWYAAACAPKNTPSSLLRITVSRARTCSSSLPVPPTVSPQEKKSETGGR
jgi:hypothetical protein